MDRKCPFGQFQIYQFNNSQIINLNLTNCKLCILANTNDSRTIEYNKTCMKSFSEINQFWMEKDHTIQMKKFCSLCGMGEFPLFDCKNLFNNKFRIVNNTGEQIACEKCSSAITSQRKQETFQKFCLMNSNKSQKKDVHSFKLKENYTIYQKSVPKNFKMESRQKRNSEAFESGIKQANVGLKQRQNPFKSINPVKPKEFSNNLLKSNKTNDVELVLHDDPNVVVEGSGETAPIPIATAAPQKDVTVKRETASNYFSST